MKELVICIEIGAFIGLCCFISLLGISGYWVDVKPKLIKFFKRKDKNKWQ